MAQVGVFIHMLAATKMKRTALLIIILNVLALSVRSQSVIKALEKNTSRKHTQELILEISKVFELIQKNFNVDLIMRIHFISYEEFISKIGPHMEGCGIEKFFFIIQIQKNGIMVKF